MKYNIRNKDLICYIEKQLDTPAQPHYDQYGNSARAMLSRRRDSYLKSLRWNAEDFLKRYMCESKLMNLDASISEWLGFIFCTLLFPFIPLIKEFLEVRKAVKLYEREFKEER